jgi:hypothetical protein
MLPGAGDSRTLRAKEMLECLIKRQNRQCHQLLIMYMYVYSMYTPFLSILRNLEEVLCRVLPHM